MRRILLTVTLLAAWALGWSQPQESEPIRPVYSSYALEVGWGNLWDTYLTPLHYDGSHLGFLYERTQAMKFSPSRWIMQLLAGIEGDFTQNPARNANMYNLSLYGSWRMMRRWQLPSRFIVGIGSGATLSAGALYSNRNGNNPASAKAAVTLDAVGYAAWTHKLWNIPFMVRYQATLPVTGAFFSPEYAQLYYQIYLGDRDNLAHAAWWGNYFSLNNFLTLDMHFGATTLRVGYRGQILSTKVNNLVARNISHAIVVGICTEWISLRPGKKMPEAAIISAY